MSIIIKSNAQMQIFKIYFLRLVDREIVNQTFDTLHAQNRIKYSKQFILFDYLVFVI